MNQSGLVNGVQWSVKQIEGPKFLLTVGHISTEYFCEVAPIFGMDVFDVKEINEILDIMQELQ